MYFVFTPSKKLKLSDHMCVCTHCIVMKHLVSLTLSYSPIRKQNVPQEIPFFIQNQYSVIAHKKSKTPAIIVELKYKSIYFLKAY